MQFDWNNVFDRGSAGTEKSGSDPDIQLLSRKLAHLSLCCQAMWELIRDNTKLTEGDLAAKIDEVDLRDGRGDGKMGTRIFKCPQCGHRTNSARATCLMCGAELPKQHAFQS